MAKKLDTGAPPYDSSLDFDFDTDISAQLDQTASKKRGVVGNVSRGIISGAKDAATSSSFIKKTLREALPKNYGVVAEGADTVLTESYRLYDQSVRELKPRLGAITRKIDTLIPEGQKTLKGLSKKMMSLTGEDRNSTYAGTDSQEDQAVTQALGAIFTQTKQYTQDAERKQIMRDGIELKRDSRQVGFLSSIAKNTSVQAQYTTSVTQAYQKKMLELQMRGYMSAREHYALTSKFFQMFQAQNEAVIKNTSMPEFQKITNSERFIEAGKNKFFSGLYGKGSMLEKGMGRLKDSGLEILEGFKMGLDNANMLADEAVSGKQAMDDMNKMLTDMGEPPLSKMEMLGGIMGGNIVEYIGSKLSPKVKANLAKDKKFQKNLARIARMVTNPAGAIEELRRSDSWQSKVNDYDSIKGKGYRFLDIVMDHFRESSPQQSFGNAGSLSSLKNPSMGFDNKAHLSLTAVIPGYLASILREAQIARTGNEKTPLQVYNFKSGEFVTDKQMRNVIAKDLIGLARGSASKFHIDKTTREFGGEGVLSPSAEFELKVFFSKLARITNMDYTPENIMETRAYDALSPVVQSFVKSKLEDIVNSPEREVKTTGLTKSLMGIRGGMPSMSKEMDDYIQAGYGKQLKDLGLIRRDSSGDFERDEEAYEKFMEHYGISRRKPGPGEASSDINVKESIKKMNPTELLQAVKSRFGKSKPNDFMGPQQTVVQRAKSSIKNWDPRQAYEGIKKTGLFGWKYKAGEGDGSDEEHYGPMAQDVNRNMGEESAPGGKKIDLVNINGAAMAAVKHLGGQVEKLGFWKSGNPLSMIQKDVAALLAIAKRGNRGGRGKGRGQQGSGGSDSSMDYVQGDGYAPLLTNMVQSIAKLGTQVSQDVFTSAGKVFSFGKDKIAMPVIDYVKKGFNDKENPIRKGVTTLWEKATAMAGDVMAFGSKIATETLPAGWKQIKDFGKTLYDDVSKRLNEARDLYLPGGAKPIIRAIKLRSGFYRDAVTGEPIFTMDALLKCKNDIVDKTGNVVLTLEEKAQGLIDAHGERVKTTAMNFLNAGVGMAFAAKDRLVEGFQFLRERGSKAFSGLTAKAKEKWNKFDGSSFGSFGGKYLKDGYQVWVDIRSILLGGADDVRKRLKQEGDKIAAAVSAAASGGSGGGGDDDSEGNEAQSADLSERYSGGIAGVRNSISNMADRGRSFIDGITGKSLTAKEKKQRAGKIQHAKNKAKGAYYKAKRKLLGTNFGERGADYVEKMRNSKGAGWLSGKFNSAKNSGFGKRLGTWGGKAKTFGKSLPGRFGSAVSFASNLFGGAGGGEESQQQNPDDAANDPERAKELGEGKESEVKTNKGKGRVSVKDRVFGDTDGDGDADGSVSDRAEKQEALKESRKKKAAEADMSLRYKNGEKLSSFFDKLLSGATTLFSLATSGIGGLFKGVGTLLGGALKGAKAITTTAGKLLPSAGTVANGAWTAAKFIGKNAMRVAAWTAMEAIPALASGALAVASTAASAIGSVLASPVVLGAALVALTGYGIYKLYKYANRNNASDLERIRLRQYGVSNRSNEDQYNHMFYTLEAYLLDGRVNYSGGQASLISKNIKPEEIAEIFGVDKKDTEHGEAVATWFSKRFKPFFLTHVSALYAINPKTKLQDIESLKPEEKLRYIQAVGFEDGPYSVDTSPVKAIEGLNTDPSSVSESIKIIIDKLSAQVKKESKIVALPTKSGGEQTAEADRAQADYAQQQKANLTKADLGQNNIGKKSDALAPFKSPTGEDGPRTDVTAKLMGPGGGVPSSIPMAAGAPLTGAAGMQFLKLGKGVNIENMHPGTLKMLLGMAEEYGNATGKSIQVNDGFRTMAQQAALYSKFPDKAAPPGRSLHEFGLAVDINSADADALEKLGLMKKYGFTRPIGQEPWHMEPAGIQKNIELAKKDASQRDVMVDASAFKGGGGYATVANATKSRRNHDLAMSLLNIPGKPATETIKESTDKATPPVAVATDGKSVSTIRPTTEVKEAANDSQAKTNVVAISDKASNSGKLPDTGMRADQASGDVEKSATPETTGGSSAPTSDGGIKDTIAKAARRAGGDPNMMLAFAAVESDLNPTAHGGGSSKGAFGFIDSTWNETVNKYGSKYSLGRDAKSTDVEASALMATEYLKANMKSISSVRPNPNFTDAYITHLLGPGGARTFFGAEPTAIAAEVLPKAAAANKGIFYDGGRPRTIKEVHAELTRRLQAKTSKYGINVKFGSLTESSIAPKSGGMKDGNGQGITGGLPGTADAAPTPAKGPAPGTPGTAAIKPSSNSGLFIDSRASGFDNQPSKATGQPMAGPSSTKLEASVDKSNELLGSQLSVLKDILAEVSSDKLAKILTEAIAAMSKNAANGDNESVKEKDKRNMGRRDTAVNSSLDFSRKSM